MEEKKGFKRLTGDEIDKIMSEKVDNNPKERRILELRLDEVLKERGLTQKDLAEMTGIRPNAISNLARGIVERVTIDHIERIATALEIDDINELMTLQLESNVSNFPRNMYVNLDDE